MTQQDTQVSVQPEEELVAFETPEGGGVVPAQKTAEAGVVQADVTSIVSVINAEFTFQENANTPGRFLEQTRVVQRPANSGFFVIINSFRGSFTTPDFQFLQERPLGSFHVSAGIRGTDNLVCQVRLTDSNQDDPIAVRVRATVVFFT